MRLLVLGSGMQGRACAFDLLKNPDVREVVLADSSAANLAQAKGWLGSPKVRTVRADVSDAARVKNLAKGSAVVVSCVPYFLNLPLAKAAIAAKAHFIDLGGNTDIVLKELALHDKAKKAGVTIIPDNGLGPGMTCILAAHGIAQLDRADEVLIRDGGLPQKPAGPMGYMLTFSEHGLINEYVEDAVALREGRRVKVPGLSEVEELEVPGLGRLEAGHASGGLSTLAHTFEGKVRTMDNKLLRYPGHIAVIHAMHSMGFFETKRRKVGTGLASPREMSAQLFREAFLRPGDKDVVYIRVTVRGVKDGRPAEVVYDMRDDYDEKNGMTAMTRTTGFPASIVAQMLAFGAIRRPGAYPVETGVPGGPFIEEARKRGFKLDWGLRWLEKPAAVAA